MSADNPKRSCQQPHLAAGKKNAQPAGRLAGRALGTRLGTGPREKPIRHYEDENLFVVISMQRLLAFTQLGRFLFQQPEDRPPLVFTGFRIK